MRKFALLALAMLGCGKTAEETVHLFLWAEYVSPDAIAQFERETGVRVVEANFENEEAMLAKLKQPGAHYDIVVVSNELFPTLQREGFVGEFDPAKIPNLKHLDPKFVKPPYEPTGKRAVPYMWGTMGIAYNSDKVQMTEPSWGVLWDERYKGRICMFDQLTSTVAVALRYKGHSVSSRDDAALKDAKEALLAQKPLLYGYKNDEYKSLMQDPEKGPWLSMAWNGDAARMARDMPQIRYAIPKEGTTIWVDNMVLLARPCSADAAHKFLNFVMRPEVNAKIAQDIYYATCNAEARKHLPKGMPDDRTIYPDDETLKRCVFREDIGKDIEKWRRVWDEVKN